MAVDIPVIQRHFAGEKTREFFPEMKEGLLRWAALPDGATAQLLGSQCSSRTDVFGDPVLLPSTAQYLATALRADVRSGYSTAALRHSIVARPGTALHAG